MLFQNSAQGRGLTAAPKRAAPQRQKLPLSACDKYLERVGGEKKRRRLGALGQEAELVYRQRKLSRWSQNLRDATLNIYYLVF